MWVHGSDREKNPTPITVLFVSEGTPERGTVFFGRIPAIQTWAEFRFSSQADPDTGFPRNQLLWEVTGNCGGNTGQQDKKGKTARDSCVINPATMVDNCITIS